MGKNDLKDIEHIVIAGENTLCGYAEDEISNHYLDNEGDSEDVRLRRKVLNGLIQNKIEYGSNCKGCITKLKELRKIRK